MENRKLLYIFVILFLIITAIAPAAAVTLSFVDEAYLKANDYTITDQAGTTVVNFTGPSTVTLPAGKSYSVNFHPMGLFDFSETSGDFSSWGIILDFFRQNLAGLIVLVGIIGIIVTWRN
jgi:hypothetical protein